MVPRDRKTKTKVTKKASQNFHFQSAKSLPGLTLLFNCQSRKRLYYYQYLADQEREFCFAFLVTLVLFFGPLAPFFYPC